MNAQPQAWEQYPLKASPAAIEQMLRAETIADLRAAIMRGWAVHYGDGSAPALARDAVMAAALSFPHAMEYLQEAQRAAVNGAADAGDVWQMFMIAAINCCAYELVDRMADGQRITFGPLQ